MPWTLWKISHVCHMVFVDFPLWPACSCPNHVHSITTAYLLPPLGHFKPNHLTHTPTMSFQAWPLISSLPTSTMSIQAQMLISHLHHIHLSPNACFPLPLSQIKLKWSLHASTVSIWAHLLIFHLQHVDSSLNTCLPPLLSQVECKHLLSTIIMSLQAQIYHLHCVNLSVAAHMPPPPC